jgi:hypothetical protein
MDAAKISDAEIFVHVRILLGVVVSLSIARLLSGLAFFVQHPGRQKADAVHLLWVASMLLALVHFWWWQFALIHHSAWHFGVYAFVLSTPRSTTCCARSSSRPTWTSTSAFATTSSRAASGSSG